MNGTDQQPEVTGNDSAGVEAPEVTVSRDIVRRRWLVEDGEEAPTLHELAAEYGVSAERVRQIEAAAMKKMRKALSETAQA